MLGKPLHSARSPIDQSLSGTSTIRGSIASACSGRRRAPDGPLALAAKLALNYPNEGRSCPSPRRSVPWRMVAAANRHVWGRGSVLGCPLDSLTLDDTVDVIDDAIAERRP